MKDMVKSELIVIEGGYVEIPPWVKGGLWFGIACIIIDHWTDIKAGVIDGWTDAMKEG